LFELPQILAGIHRDAQCTQRAGSGEALARVERAVPAANDAGAAVVHGP
jgi:hypothetical protein